MVRTAMPTPQLALESIARRAMVAHGLLPDFSPDVLAETTAIVQPATASGAEGAEVRDLRSLLWASIDNDTSRDLDQLSVAEAMPSGTRWSVI